MPDHSNIAAFRDQTKPDPVDRPEDRRNAALAIAWRVVQGKLTYDDGDQLLQMLGIIPTREEAASTPASRAAAVRRAARARAREARRAEEGAA